jgi:hypothetical protein
MGNVARMEEMTNAYKILVGKPERKNHSEHLSVDAEMILERVLEKLVGKVWTGFI